MLETDLAGQRRRSRVTRSARERAVHANAIDTVSSERVAENAIGVGDRAPMFVLPDGRGVAVDLRLLLRSGPVVLCFYRGSWCPYCNLELRAYQRRLEQFRALDATVVALSPELPSRTVTAESIHQLGYQELLDYGNGVARQYRITHLIDPEVVRYQLNTGTDVAAFNGALIAEVPLPATFVIDTSGVVQYAFVCADYTRRAEPDNVLAVLRDLARASSTVVAGAAW